MKIQTALWMIALSLTAICSAQQSEEEKKFYADYAESEQRTLDAYPDTANGNSALVKKMVELDVAMLKSGNPSYHSPNKPMILAELAAKELGIVAVKQLPINPEKITNLNTEPDRMAEYKFEDELLPEFHSYRNVKVRKVEPDGLRIIHETSAGKIYFEQLTDAERSKYGLTLEKATEYRRQEAARATISRAQQREAAIQAQAKKQAAIVAEQKHQAYLRANPPEIEEAPVWRRFVKNAHFQDTNKEVIAEEISREDGREAAQKFLDEREPKNDEPPVVHTDPTRHLEGGKFQRNGNFINVNGDASRGYQIEGDKLRSLQTGAPTHTRSGGMWMPLDKSHDQIWDPE